MGLLVKQFAVGGYDKNFSYLVTDLESKQAAVIDPSGDVKKVFTALNATGTTPTAVWLTHTHMDHFDGLPSLTTQYGDLPIYVHKLGVTAIGAHGHVTTIDDQSTIALGNSSIKVLHTPGHADDAVCFFIDNVNAADGVPKLISGDTLFVGGCGRTNGQRIKDLYESLMELKSLPPETTVYPGHDYGSTPTSTIGREVTENKYYLTPSFEEFTKLRLS